jgi:hypothetical protein
MEFPDTLENRIAIGEAMKSSMAYLKPSGQKGIQLPLFAQK